MKIPKIKSLSLRLTLWYILIMGLLIGLAGTFLFHSLRAEIWEDLDGSLYRVAADLGENWSQTHGLTWRDAVRDAEKKYKDSQFMLMVVEVTRRLEDFPEEIICSGNVDSGSFLMRPDNYFRLKHSTAQGHLHLTLPPQGPGKTALRVILYDVRGPFVVQVGIPLAATLGQVRRLTIILFLAGLGLLLFASLGGHLIIRRALRPVNDVVRTARRITADDLSLRIEAGGRKDEIGALVDTFNEMIARLETSIARIKQFSGDVSHELRTPVTRMRGEIEVLLRKERQKEEYVAALRSVLEETEGIGRMIEDLLFLSRIDAHKRSEFDEEVDWAEMTARACGSRRAAAKEKGVRFNAGPFADASLKGDRSLLERMMLNLIDNAIRYTPAGGQVAVELVRDGDSIQLIVRDSGIGIPSQSLPHIFDRFYVADPSRSRESGGVGLGLAIAKSVADLHGARIGVESEVGKGSVFSVRVDAR